MRAGLGTSGERVISLIAIFTSVSALGCGRPPASNAATAQAWSQAFEGSTAEVRDEVLECGGDDQMPCMSGIVCEHRFPPNPALRTVTPRAVVDRAGCGSYDEERCVPRMWFEVGGDGRARTYGFVLDRSEHPEVLTADCGAGSSNGVREQVIDQL